MKKIVGNNLRVARKVNGWSQRFVSEKSGIPIKRLQSYEEGRAEPGLLSIKTLATFYGLTVDDLLKENLEVEWKRKDAISAKGNIP